MERTQQVLLDGEISSFKCVTSGLPQKIILRLFLVYINDLQEYVDYNSVGYLPMIE